MDDSEKKERRATREFVKNTFPVNWSKLRNPFTIPELCPDKSLPGVLVMPIDYIFTWARLSSIWPLNFSLACCAIEMMATGAPRFDIDRFGMGSFRASPRQSDLMIVAGTVTYKTAPRLIRLYEQLPEPKYVLAMGACAISGGPYVKHGYHVVKGVDLLVPVDVYVPGCPPRPEALLDGLMKLQEKMLKHGSFMQDKVNKLLKK